MSNSSAPILQGWTPESGGRGTWSLLWSCISTVFICLWVAYHPDVPPSTDSKARILFDRIKWLSIESFVPEIMALDALNQWRCAKSLQAKAIDLGYECSIAQAFHASMGGFCCVSPASKKRHLLDYHLFELMLEDKAFVLPATDSRTESNWFLPEKEVEDKNDADALLKAIALLQVVWFLINCVVRLSEGLPVSPLEVETAAYVYCALLSYVFWWNKPYNVQVATVLDLKPEKVRFWQARIETQPSRISPGRATDASQTTALNSNFNVVFALVLFVGFSAIHFAAWNLDFPSPVEAGGWKMASVSTILISPILVMGIYLEVHEKSMWLLALVWGMLGFYIPQRLYLIVEVLMSLRASPAAVYDTVVISNYIFHFF